ncbi:MAG: hypothetical protein FJY55_11925 [Betaproteobacteria bacterium]|nr:hypothetical protein [Betaproteobacteria bacterium]
MEISGVAPLLGGAQFGATGAYQLVSAVAIGEIDPQDPALAGIHDLEKVPRNARGMLDYRTDVVLLRPADAARGNGRLLYEVNNRGRKQLFRFLCDASSTNGALTQESDLGNAFVLHRGYTIAWSGWDATAPAADSGITMSSPVAMEDGRPMVKIIRDEFAARTTHGAPDPAALPAGHFRLSYPAASLDPAQARLSTRIRPGDTAQVIPRSRWEYIDERSIRLLPVGSEPQPGVLYDFRYPATGSPVLGLGLAVTRDVVSHLRHADAALELLGQRMTHAIAVGISQAGRYLRQHLALGFNRDASGRRVFDGVLVHVAGAGRVFVNQAFATPFRTRYAHQDHDFPECEFPFSAARMRDPASGRDGALLQGDASDPVLMECNTSSEYWKKGASLLHTDPLGQVDATLPPNARAYLIAGTSHDGRPGMDVEPGPCAYPRNPHDPVPVLRALLVALDEWVTGGKPPPESRVPTIADGSLCASDATGFPDLPGIDPVRETNDADPPADWVDPQAPTRRYRPLVSRVDIDGNETAGVRTPDIAVPLGTHTGWNRFGSPIPHAEVADKHGCFVAFAKTRDEREKRGDPRRSIAERYPNLRDYVSLVAAAAAELVNARLLLPQDAARYVERARNKQSLIH